MTREEVTRAVPQNNNNNNTVTPTPPQLTLTSLPIDALHDIASFVHVTDWCIGFGGCSTRTQRICDTILQRLQVHAVQCVRHIVAAYTMGHVHDARQLVALYASRGIPVYTWCCSMMHTGQQQQQYAVSTLLWRMEREESTAVHANTTNTHTTTTTAVFSPTHDESAPTYLMERCAMATTSSTIRIHQHLWEQHVAGHAKVCETTNRQVPLRLSVDFPSRRRHRRSGAPSTTTTTTTSVLGCTVDVYTTTDDDDVDNRMAEQHPLVAARLQQLQQRVAALQTQQYTTSSSSSTYATASSLSDDDSLLDVVWDTLFPTTAGVHSYDGATAVPRHVAQFVTQPCPAAWGTVQCEIEVVVAPPTVTLPKYCTRLCC